MPNLIQWAVPPLSGQHAIQLIFFTPSAPSSDVFLWQFEQILCMICVRSISLNTFLLRRQKREIKWDQTQISLTVTYSPSFICADAVFHIYTVDL